METVNTDSTSPKKWFIYVGDHHEGPFSFSDIQSQVQIGSVTPTHYVWTEGMSDWRHMKELVDFDPLWNAPELTSPATPFFSIETQPLEKEEPKLSETTYFGNGSTVTLDARPEPRDNASPMSELKRNPIPGAAHSVGGKKAAAASPMKFFKLLFFIAVIGSIGLGIALFGRVLEPLVGQNTKAQAIVQKMEKTIQPFRLNFLRKFPQLAQWVSPLATLPDVTAEEYRELKAAVLASLEREGPKLALALSQADPLNPSFYVASNLPDDFRFELQIEGVPGTLLNRLRFYAKSEGQIADHLGKTSPLQAADTQPLARGQYQVILAEAAEQPAAIQPKIQSIFASMPIALGTKKLIVSKPYFLGGKKDATYTVRLKEFHDKIREKSNQELLELRQFEITLESQLNQTVQQFNLLKKKKIGPPQRKQWDTFHSRWFGLAAQISQIHSGLTPEKAQNDFFHGPLYLMFQASAQAIEKFHTGQDAVVKAAPLPKSLKPGTVVQMPTTLPPTDAELQALGTAAQESISLFKTKLIETEKQPPEALGLAPPNETATPTQPVNTTAQGAQPVLAPNAAPVLPKTAPVEASPAPSSAPPRVFPTPSMPPRGNP